MRPTGPIESDSTPISLIYTGQRRLPLKLRALFVCTTPHRACGKDVPTLGAELHRTTAPDPLLAPAFSGARMSSIQADTSVSTDGAMVSSIRKYSLSLPIFAV